MSSVKNLETGTSDELMLNLRRDSTTSKNKKNVCFSMVYSDTMKHMS